MLVTGVSDTRSAFVLAMGYARMFNTNLRANELIALGEALVILRLADSWNAHDYKTTRTGFLERLEHIGFSNTLAASNQLANVNIQQNPLGTILTTQTGSLVNYARAAADVLIHESSQVTLIATDYAPPAAIIDFERRLGRPLEPHQAALQNDTVTCLKAHLARPAIVMAWALGYDIVRAWIADAQRLKAFNDCINHQPPTDVTPLFKMGERKVLDTCKNAQGSLGPFNENTHHSLVALLNDRNRFAHANFNEATINRANVFVEKMVETVTGPPFV